MAQGLQESWVAAGAPSESVVEADHDLPGVKTSQEDVFHEDLRLDDGQFAREWQHDRRIETDLGDQIDPLGQGGDGRGHPVRLQHLHGMGIERARERLQAEHARPAHRPHQDLAMADMDTVEDAEGDDGGRRVRRDGCQSADDPHGEVARA